MKRNRNHLLRLATNAQGQKIVELFMTTEERNAFLDSKEGKMAYIIEDLTVNRLPSA